MTLDCIHLNFGFDFGFIHALDVDCNNTCLFLLAMLQRFLVDLVCGVSAVAYGCSGIDFGYTMLGQVYQQGIFGVSNTVRR